MTGFRIIALLLALGAGGASAQEPADTLLYNALFTQFFGRFPTTTVPAIVWVRDSTFTAQDMVRVERPGFRQSLRAYPVDRLLVARLDSVLGPRTSVNVLSLPGVVRVANRHVSDSLRTLQRDLVPRVLPDERRPPSGVFALTRIAYDAERSHALVVYRWGDCGVRCAEVNVSYFVKQPDGAWRFVRNFVVWGA